MKNMKLAALSMLMVLGLGFGMVQTHGLGVELSIGQVAYADEAKAPVVAASPAAAVAVAPAAGVPVEVKKLPEPPAEKITWVQSVVDFLAGMPWAGKYLAMLFSALALISVFSTAVASVLMALSKGLDALGKKIPMLAVASDYVDVAAKWAAYLSMYNVQKAEEKKA